MSFQVPLKDHGIILSASNSERKNHPIRNPPTDYHFRKLGPRLKVVGLVDPATGRAASTLAQKRDSCAISAYQNTRTFKTFQDFIQQMIPKDRPRAVIIGSPPMFRGSTHAGRDIELQILKELPGVALFVEKPVATGPGEEIQDVFKIAKAINSSRTICSVGYGHLLFTEFAVYLSDSQIHASLPKSRADNEADHRFK